MKSKQAPKDTPQSGSRISSASAHAQVSGAAGGKPLRVLVIEDNSDAAETLADLLSLFGHEAKFALSGPVGVETAGAFQPDVVLCDIGLPGMDGYEVARCLRHEPTTRTARLVALTGYGRESDRQRTEEAGFDLHLVKPVEPLELKRLLDGWSASSSQSSA